ncbi:MAG TPA: hypothetical protein VM869_30790, partial [Enhygromyxa sp.]|nr:hypothetical protein [Enhygromyxa sp.]
SPTSQATIDAAFDGLDYTPELERTRLAGRTYSDLLHGFSFQLPPGFAGPPQPHDVGLGQIHAWSDGERQLLSITLDPISDDQAAIASALEQALRDVGITAPPGDPERSETTLAGSPAQQLTWTADGTQLRAQCITRAPPVHCMLYANLSDEHREQVQTSFAVLE